MTKNVRYMYHVCLIFLPRSVLYLILHDCTLYSIWEWRVEARPFTLRRMVWLLCTSQAKHLQGITDVQLNSFNQNPVEVIKISNLISHCYDRQVGYLSVITMGHQVRNPEILIVIKLH